MTWIADDEIKKNRYKFYLNFPLRHSVFCAYNFLLQLFIDDLLRPASIRVSFTADAGKKSQQKEREVEVEIEI